MRKFILVFLMLILPLSVYAEGKSHRNNFVAVDQYIESLNTDIPKDLIRAIAWVESGWRQFDDAGGVYVDGSMSKLTHKISKDFGIMQINEKTIVESKMPLKFVRKLKSSMEFNILIGISEFEGKILYVRSLRASKYWMRICKRYALRGMSERQMVILAYDGFQADHLYVRMVEQAVKDHPWEKLPGVEKRGVKKGVSKAHNLRAGK